MSDYQTILTEVEDGVGIITLNRPEKLNAMNHNLNVELQDAAKYFDEDSDICLLYTSPSPRDRG